MTTNSDFNTLLVRVHEQLQSSGFQQHASNFDRRPLIRIANSLDGPQMKLIHWKRLAELERIPHSDEEHAVEAIAGIDAFGAPEVEIIMVSHRWLRPSRDRLTAHPDLPDNRKAMAINEFSKWRRQWVLHKHGFLPEIFYWIDFPCIDQNNTTVAVPLLPMWVACCERFLRIDTEEYDSRAWCRLEPLLSYVYSFADHHLSIDLSYKFNWPDTGTETRLPILNPMEAETTLPEDIKLISPLTRLAATTKPANTRHTPVQFGRTTIKCFKL
jgi:hypothetical protein